MKINKLINVAYLLAVVMTAQLAAVGTVMFNGQEITEDSIRLSNAPYPKAYAQELLKHYKNNIRLHHIGIHDSDLDRYLESYYRATIEPIKAMKQNAYKTYMDPIKQKAIRVLTEKITLWAGGLANPFYTGLTAAQFIARLTAAINILEPRNVVAGLGHLHLTFVNSVPCPLPNALSAKEFLRFTAGIETAILYGVLASVLHLPPGALNPVVVNAAGLQGAPQKNSIKGLGDALWQVLDGL